jgi:putative FmdB family regulatory protein
MPLYEFACQDCGKSFDKLLGFSQADQPQTCPACGSRQSRRKLSAFAVGGTGQTKHGPATRPAASPFT